MDRDVRPAHRPGALVRRERRGVRRLLGWAAVVGVPLLILTFVALCIGGLVVMNNHSATAHPVLARFGLAGVVLVFGAVAAGATAALLRAYARTWRLRLHGVTAWGTVTRLCVESVTDPESPDIRHAIVRVDGLGSPLDVAVWSGRPEVGERIRVRYVKSDPTHVVHVRRTVGQAVLTMLLDGVLLFFIMGGLAVVVMLVAVLFFGRLT
jgi:hypothetical protein